MANDAYAPTRKVTGLKLSRKGYKWTAGWKVPSEAVAAKLKNRFDGIQARWVLDKDGKGKDITEKDSTGNERATSFTETFGEFKGNFKPYKGKKLEREAFYPCTSVKLDHIGVKVRGFHTTGSGNSAVRHYGPWSNLKKYVFGKPRKPKVKITYDADTQVASYTIETNAGSDHYERWDTQYRVYVQRSGMAEITVVGWRSSDKLKITGTYDFANAGINWSGGASATLWVEARARGLAGNSGLGKDSTTVVWPKAPTISGVYLESSRVRIACTVDEDSVETVQLQRQLDVVPGERPSPGSWDDVDGAVDNGKCNALYDHVVNARSTRGLQTWYRLMVKRGNFRDYSELKHAACLDELAPTAADDECAILGVTPGADGTSLDVVVAWDKVGAGAADDSTGTELTWSTDKDAWRSVREPQSHRFTWSDATSADPEWCHTAVVAVPDLREGETCYVRARRYLEGDDKTTYGPWSQIVGGRPVTAPDGVTLVASRPFVARGEAIDLSWSYGGEAVQTEWSLHLEGSDLTSLKEGSDAMGFCSLGPEDYGDATSLSLYVMVSTGGEAVASKVTKVGIADAPTVGCGCASTLVRKPATVEAYSSAPVDRLLVTAVCEGLSDELPDGDADQLPGDVVWTDAIRRTWTQTTWGQTTLLSRLASDLAEAQSDLAEAQAAIEEADEGTSAWEEASRTADAAQSAIDAIDAEIEAHPADGETFVATFEVPTTARLLDRGDYSVYVTPVDDATGLSGPQVVTTFSVDWEHKAPSPGESVTVSPFDETSEDGVRTIGCRISLEEPENAEEGDTYRLYRKTPDGYTAIADTLPLVCVVTDRFAPFGTDAELAYRVECVTPDGDVAWDEYPYELPVEVLRIDFGGEYVELPYNLSLPDSYAKGFESRQHMGGGEGGYWDGSVSRSARPTADVPRLNRDDVARCRDLGNYPGVCLVRTPGGLAYCANVDVTLDQSHDSSAVGASLSVRGIDLAAQYAISPMDITEGV